MLKLCLVARYACIYSSMLCRLLKLIFLDAPKVQKQTHDWFDTTELNLAFQKTYLFGNFEKMYV